MFKFQTRSSIIFPKVEKIKEEATKEFGEDLGRLLADVLRGIYDDIKVLERVERVTVLPTASLDNRGKFFLVNTGGVADALWIGIDTGNLGFAFRQITLTT